MENKIILQKLDGFVLKVIAMILMTIDHIGLFMYAKDPSNPTWTVFRIIGRLAFPLYAFFLAEGMRYTHSKEKYILRIGAVYGVITLAETILVYGFNGGYTADTLSPEPFADLFFCGLFLYCLLLPKWKKVFAILPVAPMILSFVVYVIEQTRSVTIHWFPYYLRLGYGLFGLLLVLCFFFAPYLTKILFKSRIAQIGISMDEFMESVEYRRQTNIISIIGLIVTVLIFWGIGYIGRGVDYAPFDVFHMGRESYCLLAGILLYFYSGKRGYDSKPYRIFTYLYFPGHLLILYLIFFFLVK